MRQLGVYTCILEVMYFARDLASKSFTYVSEDAPIEKVAAIFSDNSAAGIVVIGGQSGKELVGVVTLADLLLPGSSIYVPTILEILKNISVYGGDKEAFRAHFARFLGMKAKDIMNRSPVTISSADPLHVATKQFAENRRLNLILVVNPVGERLEGVIDRQGLMRFYHEYKSSWDNPPLSREESAGAHATGEAVQKTFEELGKFSLVTKFRARRWFGLSLIFVLIGAALAFFWIVRVALR